MPAERASTTREFERSSNAKPAEFIASGDPLKVDRDISETLFTLPEVKRAIRIAPVFGLYGLLGFMVSSATRSRSSILPYAFLAAAGTFWGLGFPFGKAALATMPVDAMVTYRLLAGSLVLLPVLLRGRIHVEKRDLWKFVVAAALYVPIQFLVQFEGLAHTSVTHAALMVATAPVLLAIGSAIVHRNASHPKWIPILISCAGAALVVLRPSGNATIYGDVLVVLSLIAGVSWVLLCESFIRRYDAVSASALMIWIGTALLVAYELLVHPVDILHVYPKTAWLASLGAGIFSTAGATVLWNLGLQRVRSADAGVFVNLEPLVGTLCGVVLFGDSLTWATVAGAALVIGGAAVVARSR